MARDDGFPSDRELAFRAYQERLMAAGAGYPARIAAEVDAWVEEQCGPLYADGRECLDCDDGSCIRHHGWKGGA